MPFLFVSPTAGRYVQHHRFRCRRARRYGVSSGCPRWRTDHRAHTGDESALRVGVVEIPQRVRRVHPRALVPSPGHLREGRSMSKISSLVKGSSRDLLALLIVVAALSALPLGISPVPAVGCHWCLDLRRGGHRLECPIGFRWTVFVRTCRLLRNRGLHGCNPADEVLDFAVARLDRRWCCWWGFSDSVSDGSRFDSA